MTDLPDVPRPPAMLDFKPAPEAPWNRQSLRVPREDETLFSRPSLHEAVELARRNRSLLSGADVNLQGRTLRILREWSRREVLSAAYRYTSELLGEALAETPGELIFTAGHQPSLFHPGVWVKNFAISEMAARTGGVALNLVIDNDTISTTRIRVPTGDRQRPTIETVPFDEDRITQPWEDANIIDPELFRTFGERLVKKMSGWNIVPLVGEMWPDAVSQLSRSMSLRDGLTAARQRLERRWGLANLELPISRLCALDPFLWFASHIFAQLPRFREIHNRVLREFRQVNRIRSRTHPVPELQQKPDGWLEAPFWMWRIGERRRKRVFVKPIGREIHLSDGHEVFAKLPLTSEGEACCAVEVLRELPAQGIRLRTRALTTTLFTRLCLCELFVHGIGGAKYDEMTDRIIARFYRLAAPDFLTLSATLHIPLAEPFDATPNDVRRLQTFVRDLEHNSDRHLTPGLNTDADTLIAEKRTLIADQQSAAVGGLSHRRRRLRRRENHDRFRRFQDVDRRLSEFTADQRRRAFEELEFVHRQLEANAVLKDRELSFCLFPAEKLRPFLTNLWARS